MVFEIGRVVVDDTQPSKRRTGSRRYLTQPVFSKKHPVVSVGDAVDDTQPPLRCTGSRRCKSLTNVDKKGTKTLQRFGSICSTSTGLQSKVCDVNSFLRASDISIKDKVTQDPNHFVPYYYKSCKTTTSLRTKVGAKFLASSSSLISVQTRSA